MKKLFTLAAIAAMAMSANAGEINLYHNDTLLADEATYQVGYEAFEIVPGILYRYSWDANLFIQADPSINLRTTVTSDLAGIQYCGLDGQCLSITAAGGSVSKTGNTLTADPENLRIDYALPVGGAMLTRNYTIDFTAVDAANPRNSKSVTITIVPVDNEDLAGVDNVIADTANGPVRFYNLQGVETPAYSLEKGRVYIRVQGNKSSKVLAH